MTCIVRLYAVPFLIAVLLGVSGCQSSQISRLLQPGQDKAGAKTEAATGAPAPIRPQPQPAAVPPPPVSSPEYPPPPSSPPGAGGAYLPPIPPRESGVPGSGTEPGAPPSFGPLLNRPPPAGAGAAAAPEAPPPPPRTTSGARVALLLPLSGPASKVGKAMRNAAQLAMFSFADDKFELLFHDTGGTPEGARAAAQLAIGDGAELILGPLLAPSVRAVADAARAANIPVIAFSSDRTVAGGGIYTMGFFPHAEVNRVVRFARARGLARFAILAPDNNYGRTVVGSLEKVTAVTGAQVVQVSYYDPQATDFSAVVRQLARYGGRRQALIDQRAALQARDDDIAKRALQRLGQHQTIGDLPFDALLVADGGKRLQAVAALLPFYDIDPKKVQMLGTGQWDEPGTGAEPALVGGWFAAPAPGARQEFETQYKSLYGKTPHRLATLAYDATALAAVLARAPGGPDLGHRAITSANGFAGRDGIFRFLAHGVAERGLAVLEALPRGARVISKSPETFEAATN